jgi:hypothetical protein
MTVDKSSFQTPTISNAVLDFGFLQLSQLLDNDLKVCGATGKEKCQTAFIRMYTTGTPSAGLYNTVDQYGAPIQAGQTTLSTVGLNSSGALYLQTLTLPNSKNVLRLTDFPNPKYNVKVDFTDAGAGTYATTLVLEYGLAL